MQISTERALVLGGWILASFALGGCDKVKSMLGQAPPADAAAAVPSTPVVAAPVEAPDAAPTTSATAVKPVVTAQVKPKDAGTDSGAVADAGATATTTPAAKPTRGAISCDAPGCTCETGAGCDIKCVVGQPCKANVLAIANATVHGSSGSVDLTCAKGSKCKFIGDTGSSTIRCTDATCEVECGGGECNMTCSGGKCSGTKKGRGKFNCTGCK